MKPKRKLLRILRGSKMAGPTPTKPALQSRAKAEAKKILKGLMGN